MRSRRKVSPKMRKLRRILIIFFTLFLCAVTYFELTVKEKVEAIVISQICTIIENAVNNAAEDYIIEHKEICDELLAVNCTDSGNVNSITTDSYNINLLKTGINKLAQKYIDEYSANQGIKLKLGDLSGLVLLSNIGPDVTMKLTTFQTFSSHLQSSFESAGVNQTIHHVTILVSADVAVLNPFRIDSVVVETDYEVAQTVIVGTIPSTFANIMRY